MHLRRFAGNADVDVSDDRLKCVICSATGVLKYKIYIFSNLTASEWLMDTIRGIGEVSPKSIYSVNVDILSCEIGKFIHLSPPQ